MYLATESAHPPNANEICFDNNTKTFTNLNTFNCCDHA